MQRRTAAKNARTSNQGGKGKSRGGAALGGGSTNAYVDGHAVHVRSRFVKCGKNCSSCPHGPYLYEVWREDGGRVRERYVGKGDDFT